MQNIGFQSEARTQIKLHESEETTLWEQVSNFFFGDRELPERFNNAARSLHQAGYRGNRAVRIYWGLRIFLCLALGFEFVNGFHDTANAVATVIYTHSLEPHLAVVWSGF